MFVFEQIGKYINSTEIKKNYNNISKIKLSCDINQNKKAFLRIN